MQCAGVFLKGFEPSSTVKQGSSGELCEASQVLQITPHLCFYSCSINFSVRENDLAPGKNRDTGSGLHLVSCTSTADAQGHGCSVPHVRIVTLRQQRNDAGALFRGPDRKQKRRRRGHMLTCFKLRENFNQLF